jgi:hypothetical protein
MSHSDAWKTVGLDLLQVWHLIPVFLIIIGGLMLSNCKEPEEKEMGGILYSVGLIWVVIVIGSEAGWWS